MGRKSVRFVGERRGYLEILEVLPQNSAGTHVKVLLKCHNCNSTTEKSSVTFKKSKSCGCDRRNTNPGKFLGAKSMPWQLPHGEAAKRLLIKRYKRTAQTKKLSFTLSTSKMESLFKGCCHYCGRSETNTCKGLGKTSGDYKYVGIDRVDTSLGYEDFNVVSCCWLCNMMKNSLSKEIFIEHVTSIYNYQNKGN